MLNSLGLGIILTMRDYASMPAGRVQRALLGLDNTAKQFSYRFIESMYHVREGMNMMASGLVTLLAPMGILRSSFATHAKLQHLISQGLENVNVILEESLKLSNEFADITRENFMEAAYWIRSGLYWLSDEDVAKFTRNALIVAKATRASADEMAQLFVTGYGIFKDLYKEMSDAEFIDMFAGGLTEAVRAFNTEGHQMVLAFNDLNADASAVLYNLEEQLAALGLLQQTMPGHRAGTRLRAFVQGAVEAAMEFNYPIVDAEGHLMSIADLIDRLKKDFKDIANVQNIYALRKAFGSREAFSVLQLFWEKTDQLREMQEIVRQGMIKGMSVAEHMAYVIDRTLGQQLKILEQRAHNLIELIAEHMEGPAVAVVNLANKFMLLAQNVVKANRFLVRFTFTMTTLLGVSLVLAGAIRIFFGYIGLIRSSLFLLTKRSAEFAATLLKASKIFGPLIAAAAAFYAAYQANFLGIRDFIVSVIESLNQLWYRVVLVIRGFWELASSLTELRYGRISAETKWLLESLGLWDFVKDLFMIYVRVVNFLNSFYQGFKSTMEKIKAVVVPMLDVIRAVFTPIIKIVEVAAKALGLIGDSVSQTDVEMLNLLGRALGAIIGPLLALKGIKIVGSSFMGAIEFFRSIERTRLERLNKVLLPLTRRNLSKDAKKALGELLEMKQEYDELLASGMDPQSQTMKALRASMRYRIQKAGLGQFFPDLIKQANKEANKEIAKLAGKPQKTSIFSRFLNVLFAIPKGFLNRINIWTKSITNATKYIQEHGLRKSLQTLFANLGKTKPVTAIKGFADSIRKSLKSAFTFIKNLPNTIVQGFKGIFNYVKSLTVAVFNLAKAILNFVRVILMQTLFPVLKTLWTWLSKAVTAVAKFAWTIIKSAVTGLVSFARHLGIAAARLITFAARALMAAITGLVSFIGMMAKATASVISFVIANAPLAIVGLIIAGLVAGVILLWKNWGTVKQKFLEFAETLMQSPIVQRIIEIGTYIKEHILDPIIKAFDKLMEFLKLKPEQPYNIAPLPFGQWPERPDIYPHQPLTSSLPSKSMPYNTTVTVAALQPVTTNRQSSSSRDISAPYGTTRTENVINVNIDGKTVARVVADHVDRQARRRYLQA